MSSLVREHGTKKMLIAIRGLLVCVVFSCAMPGSPAAEKDDSIWNFYYASPSRKPNPAQPVFVETGTAKVILVKNKIRIEFIWPNFPERNIVFESTQYSKERVKFQGLYYDINDKSAEREVAPWTGEHREMLNTVRLKEEGIRCISREIILRPTIGAPYKVFPSDGGQIVPEGVVISLVQQQDGGWCA